MYVMSKDKETRLQVHSIKVATLDFKISSLLGLSAVSYLELTLNDSGMRITKRLNSKINFPNTFNK